MSTKEDPPMDKRFNVYGWVWIKFPVETYVVAESLAAAKKMDLSLAIGEEAQELDIPWNDALGWSDGPEILPGECQVHRVEPAAPHEDF